MTETKQLSPLTKYIYWLKSMMEYDSICDNLTTELCMSLDELDKNTCRIINAYVNMDKYMKFRLDKQQLGKIMKKTMDTSKITYVKTVKNYDKESELRKRYPTLKSEEISMLIDMEHIDECIEDDKITKVKGKRKSRKREAS